MRKNTLLVGLAALALIAGAIAAVFFVVMVRPLSCPAGLTAGPVPPPEALAWHLDAVQQEGRTLRVQGWAFRPGLDTDRLRCRVLLKNAQHCLVLPTRTVPRPDLTTAFAAEEQRAYLAGPGPVQYNPMRPQTPYALNDRYLVFGGRVFYDRGGFEALGFVPLLPAGTYQICLVYAFATGERLVETGVEVQIEPR